MAVINAGVMAEDSIFLSK